MEPIPDGYGEKWVAPKQESPLPAQMSAEDVYAVKSSHAYVRYMTALSDKAFAEMQTAEAQDKVIMLSLFVKYGLTTQDSIDNNGLIFRAQGKVK